MIEELTQRGVLMLALKNWDVDELQILLEFIASRIGTPKYQKILIETMSIVLGKLLYIFMIGKGIIFS
jgi:UTP15 C terminal